MKEYAVYRDEEILGVGTVKELAKQLNVKEQTVRFWATPSNINRRNRKRGRLAIRIEEED